MSGTALERIFGDGGSLADLKRRALEELDNAYIRGKAAGHTESPWPRIENSVVISGLKLDHLECLRHHDRARLSVPESDTAVGIRMHDLATVLHGQFGQEYELWLVKKVAP